MGWYRERVLPHLIHGVMRDPRFETFRRRIAGGARGRVLELGIGSGLNLPFYGAEVTELIGIDPSRSLLRRARRAVREVPFPVWLLQADAARLPLQAGCVDTVVSSWTLCSIPDLDAALAEIIRVLRPGGCFRFVEHGRSEDRAVARLQRILTPLWRPLAGGCHLDRPIDVRLRRSGLVPQPLERGYLLPGPRFVTYHYVGSARRADPPR